MDQITTHLQTLGFTPEEITIYLCALQSEHVTALSLSKSSGIPRTTVYLLIDALVEKKILSPVAIGEKNAFKAISPEKLVHIALKKKDEMYEALVGIRAELPALQALYHTSQGKPKMRYYQGVSEVEKVVQQALESDLIYLHCMLKNRHPYDTYLRTFREEMMQKMIRSMEIVTDQPHDVAYAEQVSSERNQVVSASSTFSSDTALCISGTTVIHIIHSEQAPQAILIQNELYAYAEVMRFMMLWKTFKS